MTPRLELTRAEILAFRRHVGALDERLPHGARSLRVAAWAGLQDSVPRSAVLSIHARVAGARPDTWEHPSLVQLWGPRYSAYVVAKRDLAVFSLGRLPDGGERLRRAEDLAARLRTFLDGRRMRYDEAGHGVGVNPNALRYAAATGTILIRWEGARLPVVWTGPRPDVEPAAARAELARRHLHVFGPTTPEAFARWAGITTREAGAAHTGLAGQLSPVRTPIGDAWILAGDEEAFRSPVRPPAPARLLPSGDAFFLLQGRDRELLVPDAAHRGMLWTSRVWPGAVLVGGEVVGTWRRAGATLDVDAWRRLSGQERGAVEAEARSLPLPEAGRGIAVRWTR